LWRDVPVEFEGAVRDFIKIFPKRIDEYEALLTKNPLFLDRTAGHRRDLRRESALSWGVTGPILRASGVDYDLRKARPYSGYEQYDFDRPRAHRGRCTYARYVVRIEEMRQSLRIIRAGAGQAADGPGAQQQPQVCPAAALRAGHQHGSAHPPLQAVDRGLQCPKGSGLYAAVESPRGELGVFLEGDGGPKPLPRPLAHAVFCQPAVSCPLLAKATWWPTWSPLIGSIDIVLGDIDR
jgi:NADH-quinone oxidoreductase subunit D